MPTENTSITGNPVLAIVVVTYNRPGSLTRLLGSLAQARFDENVPLIISIDGGGPEEVLKIAGDFKWEFGEKQILTHQKNMGLRNHILTCGDLSAKFDGIILLEDDLYVAPYFYDYALQAYQFYANDERIGGVSLYAHGYNETAQFPFIPLDDGTDVFFIQYASSWGQMWTTGQWKDFRDWYQVHRKDQIEAGSGLPPNVLIWPESSWKKYYIKYLVDTDRYFVFPRFSLTTNFVDAGHHMKFKEHFLQESMAIRSRPFRFAQLDDSLSVYDVHLEILPRILKKLNPILQDYDFAIDLYNMKKLDVISEDLVMRAEMNPAAILSFGRQMKPHEANIICNIPGRKITLGKKTDYSDGNFYIKMLESHRQADMAYHYKLRRYHFYSRRLLFNKKKKKGYSISFLFKKAVTMIRFVFERIFR